MLESKKLFKKLLDKKLIIAGTTTLLLTHDFNIPYSDKIAHFFMGYTLSRLGKIISDKSYTSPLLVSLGVVMKEIGYDFYLGKGTPEISDALMNYAGYFAQQSMSHIKDYLNSNQPKP